MAKMMIKVYVVKGHSKTFNTVDTLGHFLSENSAKAFIKHHKETLSYALHRYNYDIHAYYAKE